MTGVCSLRASSVVEAVLGQQLGVRLATRTVGLHAGVLGALGVAAGVAGRGAAGRDAAGARDLRRGGCGAGEVPDLATAAVWGLVRSAQSEHPERILLVDYDGSGEDSRGLVCWRARSRSWRCVEGQVFVPRLARVVTRRRCSGGGWLGEGRRGWVGG